MATFTKHSEDDEGLPHATKKYVTCSQHASRRLACDRTQSQDYGGPSPQVRSSVGAPFCATHPAMLIRCTR